MSTEKTHCPKCSGEMVQGFIVDRSGSKFIRVSSWVEGTPEKSFWSGTIAQGHVPVGTFRCSACGFLESYARPEFDAR
jgi:Domain of unknown function (DUF6487)